MNIIAKIRKINPRHYICIVLTICIGALSLFFFRSYYRIWESLQDLWISILFYFTEIFYLPSEISPTINNIANQDIVSPIFDIISFDNFKSYFEVGFKASFNIDTMIRFLIILMKKINDFLRYILICLPLILLLVVLFRKYFLSNNNENNEDSKPLKSFKAFELKIYKPIKVWLRNFSEFVKEKKVYIFVWLTLFMLYFNFFTIIIEFVAFYLYFVVSFDFAGIFVQMYKLFLDLLPLFKFVPLPIWILSVVIAFNAFRKKIAYQWLYHLENRNKGFINSTGQVTMICSPMGKGKTTTLTDMALSQEIMFRNKAFELLLENDLKFPNFPFINLEIELKRAINYHQVYNLATAKEWIRKKRKRCSSRYVNYNGENLFTNIEDVELNLESTLKIDVIVNQKKCFDYDFQKYGFMYYDSLKKIHLFDMLENYVQLYFVYFIESSLLVSNYGIREDNLLKDLGFFPMWQSEFFKTDDKYMQAYSRHAHILDMDMLRLGKKIIKDNNKSNALEFGVIVITEGGKERGNMLDTKEMKKNVDEANQKNDMFNKWLKMCRHSATIDNFPFIKVFIDEQRPESMGADVRELCEKIIFIDDKSEMKTLLLLFRLETMIYESLSNHFSSLYYKYRFVRGDNTLFMYLFKNIYAKYNHYYMKLINTFGYYVNTLESEKGTLDENFEKDKYYIMRKKIYSKRFATDCFSDFFATKAINSSIGINDLEEFQSERATIEELQSENSYFINDLMKK